MADETSHGEPGQPGDGADVSRRRFLGGAAACSFGAAGVGRASPPSTQPRGTPVNPRLFTFVGGTAGPWAVEKMVAAVGDPLPAAKRMNIVEGAVIDRPAETAWLFRGVTSNERYATRAEKDRLVAKQVALGRPAANRAALIPIRKSAKWWALTQDERRAVFEDTSRHVQTGLKYLPAVARRLHHCRDLGEAEPFDFITLFDFAPADATAFDDLVAALRATAEWKFVEREVDIRLARDDR